MLVSAGTVQDTSTSDAESEGAALRSYRYALVDPAQDRRLPAVLRASRAVCLLGDDEAIRAASPHLVELPEEQNAHAWNWIAGNAPQKPCVVLLASKLDYDALFQHLLRFVEVQVNARTTMLLAWWDPAILASLLGQPDDDTLYVKGPVFDAAQRHAFTGPMYSVGYWDRLGRLRNIGVTHLDEFVPTQDVGTDRSVLPLAFSPDQVRLLVKAATPDQVLYELRLNQPGVLSDRSDWENYRMACELLDAADSHGIRGLQDLVNFTGAGMILGERFHRFPPIAQALVAVKEGRQAFTEMLKSLPADLLEQAQMWASEHGRDKEGAEP